MGISHPVASLSHLVATVASLIVGSSSRLWHGCRSLFRPPGGPPSCRSFVFRAVAGTAFFCVGSCQGRLHTWRHVQIERATKCPSHASSWQPPQVCHCRHPLSTTHVAYRAVRKRTQMCRPCEALHIPVAAQKNESHLLGTSSVPVEPIWVLQSAGTRRSLQATWPQLDRCARESVAHKK